MGTAKSNMTILSMDNERGVRVLRISTVFSFVTGMVVTKTRPQSRFKQI